MYDGAVKSQLTQALQEYGLRANKKFGQNFLCEKNTADAIVRQAGELKDETVLEIGPGAGAITTRLCEAAREVYAVEIDSGLYSLLSDRLAGYPNLHLIHADALKLDYKTAFPKAPTRVVANLPYYITTPLLMRMLWDLPQADGMVLMMQKEVAKRICAAPKGKDFGSLSLAVQYYCEAKVAMQVPPECFYPAPEVDSCVVKLTRRDYGIHPKSEERMFEVIRAAFQMRRKTILNNLGAYDGLGKAGAAEALSHAGIPSGARAESLDMEQFIRLSDAVDAYCAKAR